MRWIEFRKLVSFPKEYEDHFSMIAIKRIVTQYRIEEVAEDPEKIGRMRKVEERVVYFFFVDLWLFVIRFNIPIWLPSKQSQ